MCDAGLCSRVFHPQPAEQGGDEEDKSGFESCFANCELCQRRQAILCPRDFGFLRSKLGVKIDINIYLVDT